MFTIESRQPAFEGGAHSLPPQAFLRTSVLRRALPERRLESLQPRPAHARDSSTTECGRRV